MTRLAEVDLAGFNQLWFCLLERIENSEISESGTSGKWLIFRYGQNFANSSHLFWSSNKYNIGLYSMSSSRLLLVAFIFRRVGSLWGLKTYHSGLPWHCFGGMICAELIAHQPASRNSHANLSHFRTSHSVPELIAAHATDLGRTRNRLTVEESYGGHSRRLEVHVAILSLTKELPLSRTESLVAGLCEPMLEIVHP